MEKCIDEIREWMRTNILILNDERTEVLIISTPYFRDSFHEIQLTIGDDLQHSESVRNLDVLFDNLDMSNYIKTVCMASFLGILEMQSHKLSHGRQIKTLIP